MRHKVYMRDWYFNAGIGGFLTIAADGKDLDSINGLLIGENYIEFEDAVFEGFEEKFIKQAFFKFFSLPAYSQRLKKALEDVQKRKEKLKTDQLAKKIEEIEKSPYKSFLRLLEVPVDNASSADELISAIENAIACLGTVNKNRIFDVLSNCQEGKESLNGFISWRLKGVCSHDSIGKLIEDVKGINDSKKLKSNDLCPSCQERKAEYEFNNAISNIIGFNKDNSNWIWGYKSSKAKLCPLCALIYNSAFGAFAYVLKKVDSDYLNYFYFVNQNSGVKSLFDSVTAFNLQLSVEENENKVLYAMIKESVRHINANQAKSVKENINFIEIADNPILAGQSSKGYNIYNYNIDADVAAFLDLKFKVDAVPKGSYVIKKTYYSVEDELLRLAILRQVDYQLLYRYFSYYLNESARYNLNQVTRFIVDYIQQMRGEHMEKSKTIVKKGFKSGIELRNELLRKDKANQINGLVYGFLNDLKIADREKFLDKYIRVMMSNKQPIFFSQDEMLDKDYFLQFGYSFINGLLSKEKGSESNITDLKEGN